MEIRIDRLLSNIILASALLGCTNGYEQEVNCTEEFRAASLNVPGEPLTDFFTIRLSNSDTIRYNDRDLTPGYYTVLNDKYVPKIKNQQDAFRFIGKRGNEVIVQEDFIFKADECHIMKVSGKEKLRSPTAPRRETASLINQKKDCRQQSFNL